MTTAEIRKQALKLSVDEQLDLAQALWERASPTPVFSLSDEVRTLLEDRRAEALANPEGGIPWEQVEARRRR
jgi:putative addiction module component (TIGR02574 family)